MGTFRNYIALLLFTCVVSLKAPAQKTGIGTSTPQAALHIKIPADQWFTQMLTYDAFSMAGFVGMENNGSLFLSSGFYKFFQNNAYIYGLLANKFPLGFRLNQLNQSIELLTSAPLAGPETRMKIDIQARVGIGVATAQQNVSIAENMVVDESNSSNGIAPSIRLGSASGEGIGSRRVSGAGQYNLGLYTAGQSRMNMAQNGHISVGNIDANSSFSIADGLVINQSETISGASLKFGNSSGVGMGISKPDPATYRMNFYTNNFVRGYISQAGNLHIGNTTTGDKLNVEGNIVATRIQGTDFAMDRLDANTGIWGGGQPAIRFGGATTGEGITSQRTPGDRRYGINFYTASQLRMYIVGLTGRVDLFANLTVQNGKGILRSTVAATEKLVYTSTNLNRSFNGYESFKITLPFTESFSAPPDAWVVNRASGAGQGGWAEMMTTITNVTATHCDVWVYNSTHTIHNVNFNLQIAAMGAE